MSKDACSHDLFCRIVKLNIQQTTPDGDDDGLAPWVIFTLSVLAGALALWWVWGEL